MTATQSDLARQILVAIPALNEEAHIEACLHSLLDGDPELSEVDIVVADGGSTDATRARVATITEVHPNVSLIDNPGRIQSAGVNAVVETVALERHRILVRVDAHSVYPPGYIMEVARQLVARDVAALATTLDATGQTCFARGSAWIVDTPLGSGGSGHRGGTQSGFVDHGHHAGLHLDWFKKIGGYDVTLPINEDADYDTRLRRAGGRIWLAADIRIDYQMRPTPKGLVKQYWRYGVGRAQTTLKNGTRPAIRQILPALNAALLVLSLLLTLISPIFWAFPVFYLLVALLVSLMIAIKRRSLCGLWAGLAMICMHVSWGFGYLVSIIRGYRS